MKKNIIYLIIALVYFTVSCKKEESMHPGDGSSSVSIIEDNINGNPVLVVGSKAKNFIVSFEIPDDSKLIFKPTREKLPVIMQDNEGNLWDIFGNALYGPGKGQQLKPTKSYMGYWFSFATIFPVAEIYEGPILDTVLPNIKMPIEWTVPKKYIFAGGTSEAIPALDNPEFIRSNGSGLFDDFYYQPDDLVLGIKKGNVIKAYPVPVLNYHELINDQIGEENAVITYCPLTGTGIAWNSNFNGNSTGFHVSGLLYNSNLIPVDRKTGSLWSQMRIECINGEFIGHQPVQIMMVETTLSQWLLMYPDSEIVSGTTGYDFDYSEYPFNNYRESKFLSYPVYFFDTRLHPKEKVHGIIYGEQVKVYRFSNF